MKSNQLLRKSGLIFLLLTILLGACMPMTEPTPTSDQGGQVATSKLARIKDPKVPSSDQEALAAANRAFAADLYQKLRTQDGNLIYSPYSISLALAMTYGGARTETEQQMADTLHFTLPQDQLHPAFNALDQYLESLGQAEKGKTAPTEVQGQSFQLDIANSIWGQKDFDFLQSYLDLLAQNYGAGLRLVDFVSDPEAARQQINDWVSQQTNEKIQDLFPQGSIDGDTRLALVNTIYFKASWLNSFLESNTQEGVFHLQDGEQVSVPMMKSGDAAKYYARGADYQAVGLPYFGDQAMMVIVLPDEGKFDQFEAGLTADKLDAVLKSLDSSEVDLTMPKFEIESEFSLPETLADMGMPAAFDPNQADFSGMDGRRDLYISQVMHKAFVSVDEKGTEAAAATGVAISLSAVIETQEVTVDRPFLFFIYEPAQGTVLFAGRVMNPAE